MDIKTAVGQKFVSGFPGTEMSSEFISLVKNYKVSNVILFQHNIVDSEQLKALCQSVQTLVKEETGHPAFIFIDQEGGVVTRLPDGACNMPGAMAVSATGEPENARLAAQITADEMYAHGINFNLAPVMDVNSNAANPVIGVRSFGDTAETVTDFGCASLKGYASRGMLTAVKHFPGHGDTNVDSHIGLPVIDKSLKELEDLELRPFAAAIANGVPAVMSSHILFPQLEPERIPCTMSRRIMTDLLKGKMGFKGLVVSDCLEMDAIIKFYGHIKGAVDAMHAGIDLIFLSHTAKLTEEAARAALDAIAGGKLSSEEIMASAAKIIEYKEKHAFAPNKSIHTPEESKKTANELRRKSITITQGELTLPGSSALFTGCANFRATLASNALNGSLPFPEFMAQKFGAKATVSGSNPDSAEIEKITSIAKNHDSIIMCTYNAHLMPGQLDLLKALADLHIPMTVVALRNPYDLSGLPKNVTGIAAWDYSAMTLEILAEMFAGKFTPTGKLPVSL